MNYSSLSLIQECKRKASYRLREGLVYEGISAPLVFGSAIHKALETWYGGASEEEAIYAFVDMMSSLESQDDNDKRSVDNGLKILKAYFKQYAQDNLEIYSHEGKLCIEMEVSFIIYEDKEMVIEYFGTIDCIMRNKDTGLIFIADHKTTAALGRDFFNRINPNFQITGYIMAAQAMGIDTDTFMINGIQVAKTKQEFARQYTNRTEEDFNELRYSVVFAAKEWLTCIASDTFPQTTPNPCSSYGGCTYLELCSVPKAIRQNVINSRYKGG